MIFWLLLSGHYDLFHILLGVISVSWVILLNWKLPPAMSHPGGIEPALRWRRLVLYLPWLFKEMVLSALHVARATISPRASLSPTLVRFRSEQPNEMASVLLGNSITLTPGTLTIDIVRNEFLVHALTQNRADGLLTGKMQAKVARLFTDEPGAMVKEARCSRQWKEE